MDGSRFVTAYGRCATNACHATHTYVRTSQTGKTWSAASDAGAGFAEGLEAHQTIDVARFAGAVDSSLQFSVRVGH